VKKTLKIYWSRRDFRLLDNPALNWAVKESQKTKSSFLPLFILEDYMTCGNAQFQFGYPARFFISRALPIFAENFSEFLIIKGTVLKTFKKITEKFDVEIFVNEDIHPDFYKQIKKIKEANLKIHVSPDMMTVDKNTKTGQNNLYSVFTPFKKSVWLDFVNKAQKTLPKINLTKTKFIDHSEIITIKNIFKKQIIENKTEKIWAQCSKKRTILIGKNEIDLDDYVEKPDFTNCYFSENEALKLFKKYLKGGLMADYNKNRNSLEDDVIGKTSKMSTGLAWGLISARTLTNLMQKHFNDKFENPFSNRASLGALTFISELIWREFYKYLLYHNPKLLKTEFQQKFRHKIKWADNKIAISRFLKWIKGETGYPIVDASMKQIEKTAWMHNRSRMIVASILTKNFGVDWRWGQEFFRATLIDLDEASNNGGWQWGASVGADPKPIRIFNPELQARNYDKNQQYQKKWLGQKFSKEKYIKPIIEHVVARKRALIRYNFKLQNKR
jgi:deoxyribodipyrimidine photolyase